jgi:uncharacterized protein
MRKLAKILAVTFGLGLGCQRAEGGAATELDGKTQALDSKPAKGSHSTPAQPSASAPRSSCVVPMAEPPRPQAKPADRCPLAPDIAVPPTHGRVTFVEAKDRARIDVELAVTSADQQRGLMYRTQMAENVGMLFSWSDERVRTFWMHNTCLPLDMLFIAKDGTITGILEQVPVLNDDPRSIPCKAAYVLEVNAGYCRKHGVMPGQRLQIDSQ